MKRKVVSETPAKFDLESLPSADGLPRPLWNCFCLNANVAESWPIEFNVEARTTLHVLCHSDAQHTGMEKTNAYLFWQICSFVEQIKSKIAERRKIITIFSLPFSNAFVQCIRCHLTEEAIALKADGEYKREKQFKFMQQFFGLARILAERRSRQGFLDNLVWMTGPTHSDCWTQTKEIRESIKGFSQRGLDLKIWEGERNDPGWWLRISPFWKGGILFPKSCSGMAKKFAGICADHKACSETVSA